MPRDVRDPRLLAVVTSIAGTVRHGASRTENPCNASVKCREIRASTVRPSGGCGGSSFESSCAKPNVRNCRAVVADLHRRFRGNAAVGAVWAGRTSRTGHGASWTNAAAVLPSTNRGIPVCPWVLATMREASMFSAWAQTAPPTSRWCCRVYETLCFESVESRPDMDARYCSFSVSSVACDASGSITRSRVGCGPNWLLHDAAIGSAAWEKSDPSTVTIIGLLKSGTPDRGPTRTTGPSRQRRRSSATLPTTAADRPRPWDAMTTVAPGWRVTKAQITAVTVSSEPVAIRTTGTTLTSNESTSRSRARSERSVSCISSGSKTTWTTSRCPLHCRASATATSTACQACEEPSTGTMNCCTRDSLSRPHSRLPFLGWLSPT